MSQIISKISIKNSSGTYDTRDIGAKGQNVKVGYDASGKIIPDVDSQTPTTTKQLTKVLQDAEENISNLNKNKAPDNHAWSDADSGVNHGLADGTHYGHIKVGDGLTVNSGKVDVAYGNSDNTACEGNDTRLSDARKNPNAITFTGGKTNVSYDGSEAKTVTADTVGAAPAAHTTVNATSSILGHVKVGTGITNKSGTISVSYGSAAGTACEGNDSRLSNARPASDVYAWAKASSKPSYSWSEITNKPSTFTPASHTHNEYAGYEEGTFSLILGKNANSYNINKPDIDQVTVTGRYQRVGNMCYIAASEMVVFSDNTKGYLRIAGGLPFTLKDGNNSIGFIGIDCTPVGTMYPVNYLNVDGLGGEVQFKSVEVSQAIHFKVSLWYEIGE